MLHPTSGRATVLGVVPWSDRRRLAARIGTLFGQRSVLWTELTPRQSYRMLAAVYGLDRDRERARLEELAQLFDAGDLFDVPVRSLSLGVVNHGEIIHDSPVAAMRAELRATRLVQVGLDGPVELALMAGVRVLDRSDAEVQLSVDTSETSLRAVLDHLLDVPGVTDVAVVDPPLEDVIARIYERPVP